MLRGVDGATIEGIAAAAGVTKRTLYLRYGSKEGLLRAVIGLDSAPTVADIAAAMPSGSLKERLLFVAGSYLDLSLSREALDFSLLMEQISHSRPELIDGAGAARIKPLIDLLKAIITEASPRSEQDDDRLRFVSTCLFVLLVIGPRLQILRGQGLENTAEARARHLEQAFDLIAAGAPELRAEPPPSGETTSPPAMSSAASRASETDT